MNERPEPKDRLERIERTLKSMLSEIKAVVVVNRTSLETKLEVIIEECIERIENVEKRLENMPEEIEQRGDHLLYLLMPPFEIIPSSPKSRAADF